MTVAIDVSSLLAFLGGQTGGDLVALASALENGEALLPPLALSKLLSEDNLSEELVGILVDIPTIELTDGYWARTGIARANLKSKGVKVKLGDALTAQACLDADIGLITRDKAFSVFAEHCGLRLF